MITLYAKQKKRHRCIEQTFGLCREKARVGCFKRTASKPVYYLGWNRSPAQVGCMRQALGPGALGRPRGMEWRGRWEGGWGWGTHVNPWLIHVNVWQNPLQYCKLISLQLIKKIKKKICTCKIKVSRPDYKCQPCKNINSPYVSLQTQHNPTQNLRLMNPPKKSVPIAYNLISFVFL